MRYPLRFVAWLLAAAAASMPAQAGEGADVDDPEEAETPVSRVESMGDALPAGALLRIGTRRLRHGDQVNATVFSADGQTLYTAGRDGAVRVWEMPTGRERYAIRLADGESVDDLVLSPDGTRLVGACGGGRIVEWAAADGAFLRATASEQQLTWLAFTPDGRHLLTAGNDGTLFIRDADTVDILRPLKAHADDLVRPAALPDGTRIYTAGDDEKLRAWDLATGTLRGTWTDGAEAITTLAVSRDGRCLATGGSDGTVCLRDPATARILRRFTWGDSAVNAIAFTPGDAHLAVAVNASIQLVSVVTGEIAQAVDLEGEDFNTLAFSPDGRVMAAASGCRVLVLDLEPCPTMLERRIGAFGEGVLALAATPDGRRMAVQTQDRGLVLWDVETDCEVRRIDMPAEPVLRLAFSADGSRLAGGEPGAKTVTVWDAGTGEVLRRMAWDASSLATIAFVPGSHRLVIAGGDGWISLWDVASGETISERKADKPGGGEAVMEMTSDGRSLCLAQTGRVEVIPLPGLDKPRHLASIEGTVTALSVSPDGRRVAAGSASGRIWIWDVADGRILLEAQDRHPDESALVALVFEPGGGRLLSVGAEGRNSWAVWDSGKAGEGAEVLRYDVRPLDLGMAVVLRDGRILSGAHGCTALSSWKPGEGRRALLRSRGECDIPFDRVLFSPDGKLICARPGETGAQEGRLRLFDALSGQSTGELKGEPDGLFAWNVPPEGALQLLSRNGHLSERSLPGGGLVSDTAVMKNDNLMAAAFSADGRRLIISTPQRMTVWDIAGRREIRSIETPIQEHPTTLALTFDGTTAVRFRSTQTGEVWDLATGQKTQEWPLPPTGRHERVMMHDGMSFLMFHAIESEPCVQLVDIAGRKGAAWLPTGTQSPVALAVRRDGAVVAVATEGGVVLWEPWTGSRLHTFDGLSAAVLSLDFAPDGRRLVVSCADATLLVYDSSRWAGDPLLEPSAARGALTDDWLKLGRDAEDATESYRAMARLAGRGDDAVRFLAERLAALPAVPDRLTRWLRDLDDDAVEVRERAMAEMKDLGPEHEAALRQARDRAASPEVANRLDRILAGLTARPLTEEALRRVRGVRVLGRIGTEAARKALAAVAEKALYREEARAARLALVVLAARRN